MTNTWYTFVTTLITPQEGRPGHFTTQTLSAYSSSPERALKTVQRRIPAGFRMWTWFEGLPKNPDVCCGLCSSPFHDATGHVDLEKGRVWCGVCAREMTAFLKAQLSRRAGGGIRFYDHAFPPPDIDTSAADLALDSPG